VIPGADIQSCAKEMRRHYQKDAMFMADWAAERAQKNGDAEGHAVWRCVVKVIRELERTDAPFDEPPT